MKKKLENFLFADMPFPKDFRQICKKILTRLFRVFVHTYIHHFDRIVDLGAVSGYGIMLCLPYNEMGSEWLRYNEMGNWEEKNKATFC